MFCFRRVAKSQLAATPASHAEAAGCQRLQTLMRYNNFDLVRILAALQVAGVHAITHLGLGHGAAYRIMTLFPGVPIFFVVSGFLVSASLERTKDVRSYFIFRALRIYPALWVCLILSILSALLVGVSFNDPALFLWLLAQTSIGQFYNPNFLRGYGVGVLNGSLWTIPVELQFYIALPVIYALLAKVRRPDLILTLAIVGLAAVNRVFVDSVDRASVSGKLLGVSVLPYLYMFLLGVLLQRNPWFVERYLARRAHLWLLVYACAAAILSGLNLEVRDNDLNPGSAILLGIFTISAAYTWRGLHRLLRGHDLSYGLYIYHMPVINFCIAAGLTTGRAAPFLILFASCIIAYMSWVIVEQPALGLKQRFAIQDSQPANSYHRYNQASNRSDTF